MDAARPHAPASGSRESGSEVSSTFASVPDMIGVTRIFIDAYNHGSLSDRSAGPTPLR
jgi:hypothetical protein